MIEVEKILELEAMDIITVSGSGTAIKEYGIQW